VVKDAIDRKALDNISCNIIFFDHFISFLSGRPSTNSSKGLEMTISPKRGEVDTNILSMVPSHLNFDLTDKDIDTAHSTKSIDYIVNSIKKMKILSDGQNTIEKHSTGNSLQSAGQNLFSKPTTSTIVVTK
jgi:hypothetical protein